MCHRLDSVHVRGENLSLRCSCPRHTPVPAARWHATRVLLLVNRLYRAAYESPTERERHWTTFEVSVEPGPSSSREPLTYLARNRFPSRDRFVLSRDQWLLRSSDSFKDDLCRSSFRVCVSWLTPGYRRSAFSVRASETVVRSKDFPCYVFSLCRTWCSATLDRGRVNVS